MSSEDKTILLHPVISSSEYLTAWKGQNTEAFLVLIFLHSSWIERDTEYLHVFSPNAENTDQKNLCIWTLHIVFVSASFKHIYNFFDKSQYRNNLKSNQKNPRTELPKRGVNLNYA